MKTSTYFSLFAEFGTAHIPITEIGRKYFGYSDSKSKTEALKNNYPFPVFRIGGQKSIWVVDIAVVADYLDAAMDKAKKEWNSAR